MELIAENHQLEASGLGLLDVEEGPTLSQGTDVASEGFVGRANGERQPPLRGFPTPASDSGISAGPVWRSGDQVAIMFPPQEPPTEFIQ